MGNDNTLTLQIDKNYIILNMYAMVLLWIYISLPNQIKEKLSDTQRFSWVSQSERSERNQNYRCNSNN